MDISNEQLLITVIQNIVMDTPGVSNLTENLTEQLSKSLLGIDSPNKGIKLGKDKRGMLIDIYVTVDYGENIPEVAWNIQEQVAKKLRRITNVNIGKIDIHVQGVNFKRIKKK